MGNYSEDLIKPIVNNKVDLLSIEDLSYFSISGPYKNPFSKTPPIRGKLEFKKNGTTIEKVFQGDTIPDVVNLMYEFLNSK